MREVQMAVGGAGAGLPLVGGLELVGGKPRLRGDAAAGHGLGKHTL